MLVAPEKIRSKLRPVFQTDFDCQALYDGKNVITIRPRIFPRSKGLYIELFEMYVGSYRASIKFESFSRPLVEFWFDNPLCVSKAFDFVQELTPNLAIDIRFGGVRANDYDSFISHSNANWTETGLQVQLASHLESDPNRISGLYNLALASVGFALYSSGLIIENDDSEMEGESSIIPETRYERSPANRAKCIAHYGHRCYTCGLDFGETYGSIAEGFIEVHHKTPVSSLGKATKVDPIKDLVPLCSNCHSVVHMSNPPIDPDELKAMLVGGR